MLIWILGSIDVIAGIILIFGGLSFFSVKILMIFGAILLAKSSLGLLKNFASWIDFLTGLLFLISIILDVPAIISIIFGLLIIQKGIFSFL
ncbi:MAG: hypothetical protein KKF68_01420 [Nanoarchaeota archaeon]|nr:hypothetical protein [Nanoarchaeota archaeon]